MYKIYYATSNPVKFQEAEQFFRDTGSNISLQPYTQDIPEIQSLDQELVALNKAREAWRRLQKPLLAEDAGIYFSKFNQFPGTLTKFIYQAIGMEGLLKLVGSQDKALFQMHLIYYYGPDQYKIFKANCSGSIRETTVFKASKSVPFDDIFVPDGSDKTYAQLRESNQLSNFNYRVKALEMFASWYKDNKQD
jgi:non-canonical purine NTP pyrophosphatase (RdgB/HAM1 family)